MYHQIKENLVNLDGRVDLVHKGVARQVSDGASQQEEQHRDYHHVAEVQNGGHKCVDLKFREEVEDRIQKHIESRRAWREKGSPPPVIVLATQLEVAQHNGDLGAGHNQNEKHNEEKAD